MRATALLALGCYAAVARADDEASSSVAESVASAVVERPTFTPIDIKAPFFDQFLDDSRWKASHAKKENTDEEWQYVGTWNVEEPTVFPGYKGDKGLVLKDKAAHHAISAKFDKPISNKDNTLVVQYEVKLQTGLECGGAYMKLLQDTKALKSDEFSNASPYIIMFGPDRCGATNKVHFIFRHKNPKTGEYEEKHMDSAPSARLSKTSSLYTLVVKPDQTFEVFVDGESARLGSLLEDFTPAVNPEKEIDDVKDSKPADWVDEAQIDDPEAVKPADWDEDAPYEIVDEEAVKPEDWLENEPLEVEDPEAVKPEDWDDEEDGDWVAPKVSNPKCDDVSGCGPWAKPMIKNPAYKGKWRAPRVDNPAYKGVWKPRKVANPDYFEDKKPSNFEPMGAIGFELWTMQNDILFDNIYIGHSIEDANRLKEIWAVKNTTEKAQEEAAKPKPTDDPASPLDLSFTSDPVKYVTEKFSLFVEIAKRDPVEAVKFVPEIAIGLAAGAISLIALLVGLIGGGAAAAAPSKEQVKDKAQQAKDAAAKTKDQVASAVASGSEKVRDEVNKRSTRSAQ